MKKALLLTAVGALLALVSCSGNNAPTSSVIPESSEAPTSSVNPGSSEAPASSQDTPASSEDTPASSEDTPASSEDTPASSEVTESSSEEGGAKTYVFEAEYCPDIEDLDGYGYSGTAVGTNMILKDTDGYLQASNNYYLSFLYKQFLFFEFTINSDKAVSDATFSWRIACEFYDMTISSENYGIYVNDDQLLFDAIEFKIDRETNKSGPFQDYVVTTSLSLKEGENVVRFVTLNGDLQKGTMQAYAPMLDCFKITTDATLTWEPCTDNI